MFSPVTHTSLHYKLVQSGLFICLMRTLPTLSSFYFLQLLVCIYDLAPILLVSTFSEATLTTSLWADQHVAHIVGNTHWSMTACCAFFVWFSSSGTVQVNTEFMYLTWINKYCIYAVLYIFSINIYMHIHIYMYIYANGLWPKRREAILRFFVM